MRVIISKESLVQALSMIMFAVPKRPRVPVLTGVKLTATSGQLLLEAFDYEVSVRADMPADVDAPGTCLVAASNVLAWAKDLPKGATVTLACEGITLTATAGPASVRFATMPVEDYPTLPDVPAMVGTVDASVLATAVAQVSVSAGRDQTLPMMTGIHMVGSADGITMQATDRHRAGESSIGWKPTGSAVFTALPPSATIGFVAKSFAKLAGKSGAEVTIGHMSAGYEGLMSFAFGPFTITTRLLDGKSYPPLASLYPSAGKINSTALVPADAVAALVKRVTSGINDKKIPVILAFADGTVTAQYGSSESGDGPAASETMAGIALTGDPIRIGFDPKYLCELLTSFGKAAMVSMGATEPTKPAVFSSVAVDGYRSLLMPIRITTDDAPEKAKPAEKPADVAPHAFVKDLGSRRCGADGCDAGRTAKVHTVAETAPVAPDQDVKSAIAAGRITARCPAHGCTELTAVTPDGRYGSHTRDGDVCPMARESIPVESLRRLIDAQSVPAESAATPVEATPVPVADVPTVEPVSDVVDVPAVPTDQGLPVAERTEDVSVPAAPVVVPAQTSDAVDVPDTTDAGMVDRVRALIGAGAWSSVLLGKRGQREGFDALALPDGRLDRETYTAVAGQLAAFGGRWNREAKGFIFHKSSTTFRNEHIAGGEERVKAWLAAGEPVVSVPDVAPVAVPVDDVPAKVDALGNVCRPFAVPADCLDALPAGYAAALIGEGVRVHAAAIGSAVTLDGYAVTDLVDVTRTPVDCKTCIAAMRAVCAAPVVEVAPDAAPVDDAPMVGHVAGVGEVHTSDGSRGYTWCALVKPLPVGHISFPVPRGGEYALAGFAAVITCPGCAHVLACQSDGCDECARVTGGAEDVADRPDAGVFVDDVQVMSVRRIDLTATVGKPCGGCGEDVAVEPHGPGCALDPAPVEPFTSWDAHVALSAEEAPAVRECRPDVRSVRTEPAPVADVALVQAAPEVVADGSNPHPQVVDVLGRGPVDGFRWHLSAGARTKQLGKAVRQALAGARAQLGGLFTVTAPIGSRAVNVVPQVGHVVADWAPVFALVAGALAGSLADAACGCDRSADLVGSEA